MYTVYSAVVVRILFTHCLQRQLLLLLHKLMTCARHIVVSRPRQQPSENSVVAVVYYDSILTGGAGGAVVTISRKMKNVKITATTKELDTGRPPSGDTMLYYCDILKTTTNNITTTTLGPDRFGCFFFKKFNGRRGYGGGWGGGGSCCASGSRAYDHHNIQYEPVVVGRTESVMGHGHQAACRSPSAGTTDRMSSSSSRARSRSPRSSAGGRGAEERAAQRLYNSVRAFPRPVRQPLAATDRGRVEPTIIIISYCTILCVSQ